MQKCSVAVVHFDAVGDVVKQNEEYENEYSVDSNLCRYQITSSFFLNIKILNHYYTEKNYSVTKQYFQHTFFSPFCIKLEKFVEIEVSKNNDHIHNKEK